jgi:putative glutamine amidotransferase
MKPTIGITVSSTMGSKYFEPYFNAVDATGGLAYPITADTDLVDVASRLDGLVVPGGPDIMPALYYEDEHQMTFPMDPQRDRMEWTMLRFAKQLELPVVAICRGFQLINVLYGGSLQQHIEYDLHRPKNWNQTVMHEVALIPHSLLAKLFQTTKILVNSRHHQGVRANMVGAGLYPMATSPDGFVEALTNPNMSTIAIQWHPESEEVFSAQSAIFFYLNELAREYQTTASKN